MWNPFHGKRKLNSETQVNFLNEENDYARTEFNYHKEPIRHIHSVDLYDEHTRSGKYNKAYQYFMRGKTNEYEGSLTLANFNALFINNQKLENVKTYMQTRVDVYDINVSGDIKEIEEFLLTSIDNDRWILYIEESWRYKLNREPNLYPSDDPIYRNTYAGHTIIREDHEYDNDGYKLVTHFGLARRNGVLKIYYLESKETSTNSTIGDSGYYDYTTTDDEEYIYLTSTQEYNGELFTIKIKKPPLKDHYIIKFSTTSSTARTFIEIFPYVEGQFPQFEDLTNDSSAPFSDCMPVVPIYESNKKDEENEGFFSTDINESSLTDENEPVTKRTEGWESVKYNEQSMNKQLALANKDLHTLSEGFITGVKHMIRNVKDEYLVDGEYTEPLAKHLKTYTLENLQGLVQRVDRGLTDEALTDKEQLVYDEIIICFEDQKPWDDNDDENPGRKQQLENNKFIFFSYMLNPFSKRQVMKKAMFLYMQEVYSKLDQSQGDRYGIYYNEGKFNKQIQFENIKQTIHDNRWNEDYNNDDIISRIYDYDTEDIYWQRYGANYNKNDYFTEDEVHKNNDKWYLNTTGEYMQRRERNVYRIKQYRLKKESASKTWTELDRDADYILEVSYTMIDMDFYSVVHYGKYADGNNYSLEESKGKNRIGIPLPINIFDSLTIFEKDELAYYSECIEIYVGSVVYLHWYELTFWQNLVKWGMYVYAAMELLGALFPPNPALMVAALETYAMAEAMSYVMEKLIEHAIEHWGLDDGIVIALTLTLLEAYAKGGKFDTETLVTYGSKAMNRTNSLMEMQTEALSSEMDEINENYDDFQEEMEKILKEEWSVDVEYEDYSVKPIKKMRDSIKLSLPRPHPIMLQTSLHTK